MVRRPHDCSRATDGCGNVSAFPTARPCEALMKFDILIRLSWVCPPRSRTRPSSSLPYHHVLSPCTISACSLLDASNAHPSRRATTVLASPSTQLAPKPYTKPIIRRVRRKHGRLRSNRCIESAPGRVSNIPEISPVSALRYSTKISQHLSRPTQDHSRGNPLHVKLMPSREHR